MADLLVRSLVVWESWPAFGAWFVGSFVSGKKAPNLKLVTGDATQSSGGGTSGHGPFHIVALGELSQTDADKVRRLVAQVCPGAAILGIALTPRSWDIRPVVVVNGESGPSIVRFVGPEVTLSLGISSRMQDLFERLTRSRDLHTHILGWGLLEGQLWYRRELVDRPLSESPLINDSFSLSNLVSIAKGLVAELNTWHARGITHGHLTPENVHIGTNGELALLDAGVGVAVIQASNWLQMEAFPDGYVRASFAPETTSGESVIAASDVYGLGIILQFLLAVVEAQLEGGARRSEVTAPATNRSYVLGAFKGLCERMREADPKQRPSLAEIAKFLDDSLPTYSVAVSPERTPEPVRKISVEPPRGRMVSTRPATPAVPTPPPVQPPLPDPIPTIPEQRVAPEQRYRGPTTGVAAAPLFQGLSTPPPLPGGALGMESAPVYQPILPPHMLHRHESAGPAYSPPDLWSSSQRAEYPPRPRDGANLYYFLVAVLIGILAYNVRPMLDSAKTMIAGGSDSAPMTAEDLKVMWSSHRPSQMREVVKAAISATAPNDFAENLIVQSAMSGDDLADAIDIALIRVAFDRRWEMELKPADRRIAIALAAAATKLLPDLSSLEEIKFDELHPGVILAFAAATGDGGEKTVLSEIPASVLIGLPVPYKLAFGAMLRNQTGYTVGDQPVRTLARIGTRGITSADQVTEFLAEDTAFRLMALALLFSEDDLQAAKVLDALVIAQPRAIDYSPVRWAQTAEILKWTELDPKDQLLVIAGVPPSRQPKPEHLRNLFEHPLPTIRKYAIKQVANLEFRHPASAAILKLIHADPDRLTPGQTRQLISVLAEPQTVSAATAAAWLKEGPPRRMMELAEVMLLATVPNGTATPLDVELSRFLRRNGWQPDLTVLSQLMNHPEDVTRMYAYSKIYDLQDTKRALTLLRGALSRESRLDFKKQLETMIADLESSPIP